MNVEELQSQIDEKWSVLTRLVQHLAVGNGSEARQALGLLHTAAEEYVTVRLANQQTIARLTDLQGVPNANLYAEAAWQMKKRLVEAAKPEPVTPDRIAAKIRAAAASVGLAVHIDMTADPALIEVKIHGDCTMRQAELIGRSARHLASPLVRVRLTWNNTEALEA